MPRISAVNNRPRKNIIALAVSAALSPFGANAIQLSEGPPGTVMPYVAPNVILSLDDSTSMNANMFAANGTNLGWRTHVLRDAVIDVFNNYELLPDGKIRLAWQSMGNCTSTKISGKTINGPALTAAMASSSTQVNAMRPLAGEHRSNFLAYMAEYKACTNTPTHKMVVAADAYMRAGLNKNGPWAAVPRDTAQPYLGCRRNYHILLTDGGWNAGYQQTPGAVHYSNTSRTLPDGTVYNPANPQTKVFQNNDQVSTLADWAMYSWANPLKTTAEIALMDGMVMPSIAYTNAPATETIKNRVTGESFTFEKYWNPKYNPATWPHLTTFTIGFSKDALPQRTYTYDGTSWTNLGQAPTVPSSDLPYADDGDLAGFAKGRLSWHPSHHAPTASANYPMGNSSDRGHDMWQAAINGRGQFYSVERGEDLKKAFEQIVQAILPETDPDFSSSATSGSNITRYDVGRYTAAYEPKEAWKGFIEAHTVKSNGTVVPVSGWGGKNTAEWLDDASVTPTNRLILTWNDKLTISGGTPSEHGGTSFEWTALEANLSDNQKNWLNRPATAGGGAPDGRGEDRLNYVRGDRSKEGNTSTDFRERKSRQGDIINSVVWYTGAPSENHALKGYSAFVRANKNREPMIYVGGNDGMLHGFSADNGKEKIAYVPKGVIPKLRYLTADSFDAHHKYLVDGSPMTGDIDMGVGAQDPADPAYSPGYTPDWRTVLVGTLGLGGKGYFALDVTNPSDGTAGSTPHFAKANAASLVLLDRTRSELESAPDCTGLAGQPLIDCNEAKTAYDEFGYADIGHITAQPVLDDANPMRTTQITRMNNNRWAVVFGNGYNSDNQRPVLLIQYLDGDKELIRVQTTTDTAGTGLAQDNGLAAPRLVDLNGDGRVDVVYAGDNQGNMWKFDLTSINQAEWKTAFGGQPLFTARGPASAGSARTKTQPITTAPTVAVNDRTAQVDPSDMSTRYQVGGMMVFFGTGRNAAENDPQNLDVQSLYSVLDNTRYEAINTTLGKRLKVHAGAGTCTPVPQANCVPAPKALGVGPGPSGADLVEQKITQVDGIKAGTVAEANASVTLDAAGWGSGKNGWFVDLPSGTGERLLKPASFYDGSNILNIYSQIPAKGTDADPDIESCESSSVDEEHQWFMQLNIMDGKRPSVQTIDYNKDGLYDAGDQNITRVKVRKGAHNQVIKGEHVQDFNIKNEVELSLARMPEEVMRPSWRQLR